MLNFCFFLEGVMGMERICASVMLIPGCVQTDADIGSSLLIAPMCMLKLLVACQQIIPCFCFIFELDNFIFHNFYLYVLS